MRLLPMLLLAGASFAADSDVEVVRELRAGPMRYSMLVGKVDEAWLKAEALRLLGPREVTFGRLAMYGSREAATAIERESDLDECSWKAQRTSLESNGVRIEPGHCPEVSEAIKIGSNILLRTVDSRCRSTRSVIQGNSDPLRIWSMGTQHEVLAVSLRRRHEKEPAVGVERVIVHVFVRTSAKLSVESAREILARLKSMSLAQEIRVVVRNDAAFFTDCSFPAPHLFDGPGSIATAISEPALPGGAATCSAFDPFPVNCSAYGGTR